MQDKVPVGGGCCWGVYWSVDMGGTSSLLGDRAVGALGRPRLGAQVPEPWGDKPRPASRPRMTNFDGPYLGPPTPDRLAGHSPGLGGAPSSFARNIFFLSKRRRRRRHQGRRIGSAAKVGLGQEKKIGRAHV